ncbi:hypothetical protein [Bradyrhizobium sp. SEMIA]|uniref:hypothetical protein n=1 Tax=Bradyrhizobium sp. SEMIA TaxID=2597515 RepID=UPI0018A4EA10|nr:hypothetical protein [Bradyrhizobium sp. SEMIA]QOG20406.1 hypothetical protein FOM02_26715 [Bradyrhizobium sp. SEMIA]
MTLSRPQRISRPEPPGSLLKRITVAAPRRGFAEPRGGDPKYLAEVRQLPCLYCGVEPCGEAAHVKYSCAAFGMKNMLGMRVDDTRALPLCRDDHQNARHAQHRGSEEAFWAALGINPYNVTRRLYAQRGDLVAMRAVVLVAIAERSKQQ